MTLPAQYVNDVRRSTTSEGEGEGAEDEIHFCPYCSRVLYYEESAEDQHFDNLFTSEDEDEVDEESSDGDDFMGSSDFNDLDSL